MSTQVEIKEIEAQINSVRGRGEALIAAHSQYLQESRSLEEELLKEAGVWDKLHVMAQERQDRETAAKAEVEQVNQEIQKSLAILEYLQSKEPEAAPEPPAVEPAPEPEPAQEKTSRFLPRLGRG